MIAFCVRKIENMGLKRITESHLVPINIVRDKALAYALPSHYKSIISPMSVEMVPFSK